MRRTVDSNCVRMLRLFIGACFVLVLANSIVQAQGIAPEGYTFTRKGRISLVTSPQRASQIDPWMELCQESLDFVVKRVVSKSPGFSPTLRRGPVTIVMAPTNAIFHKEFQRHTGRQAPQWVLAVAISHLRLVLIRSEGIQVLSSNDLVLTLRHELTHILMFDIEFQSSRRLPRWFHEGIAMWASGETLTRAQVLQLAAKARRRNLLAFLELEKTFPSHSARVHEAYLQSLCYITWLDQQLKQRQLSWPLVIEELRQGASIDAALFRHWQIDEPEFEWRQQLAKEYSLTEALIYGFGMWHWITVLALIAIVRHLFSNREIKKEFDREEALLASLYEDEDPQASFEDLHEDIHEDWNEER